MNTRMLVALAATAGLNIAIPAPVSGAVVTFAGSIANNASNEIARFYTTTTAKSLDADGDNRYGSIGYNLFAVANDFRAITRESFGTNISVVGPYPGYATVDNPLGGTTEVRTTTGGTAGSKNAVVTYLVTNAALIPYGFRMGILTDGLNGTQYSSQAIFVEQTSGGSGAATASTLASLNNTIDMFFFDVTGVQTGDRFTVSVTAPAGGTFSTIQGVLWDALPRADSPEPTTLAISALGLLGLGVTRRRRAASRDSKSSHVGG